jgi:hypothetical protein
MDDTHTLSIHYALSLFQVSPTYDDEFAMTTIAHDSNGCYTFWTFTCL